MNLVSSLCYSRELFCELWLQSIQNIFLEVNFWSETVKSQMGLSRKIFWLMKFFWVFVQDMCCDTFITIIHPCNCCSTRDGLLVLNKQFFSLTNPRYHTRLRKTERGHYHSQSIVIYNSHWVLFITIKHRWIVKHF